MKMLKGEGEYNIMILKRHQLWEEKEQCIRLQKRFGDYDEFKNKGGNKENKIPIFETVNGILDKGIEDKTPYSLLDVGCGPGHFMWSFKEKVSKLIALDSSTHMIDLAKTQLNKYNVEVDYHVGSTWDIPLENNSVDISLQVDVCMHCGNSWQAIVEMIRVAKQYVIFTGPSFEMFDNIMDKRIGKKSFAVSFPLLTKNLNEMVDTGKLNFYKWIHRPETSTYAHRILLIRC